MSQNFKTILGTDKINNSRAVINNNFETLKSCFEGDVAPTNPVKGQQAYINGIPKWFDGADWRVMDDFHTHSNLATKTELSNGLSGKSDLTHTHTDLATNVALSEGLSEKASKTELATGLSSTAFPAGTVLLFGQASAPVGWTKKRDWAEKAMLTINVDTDGAVLGSKSDGADPQAEHTHTTPNHNHTGPEHQHTTPDHNHGMSNHTHGVGNYSVGNHNHQWVGYTTASNGYNYLFNSDGSTVQCYKPRYTVPSNNGYFQGSNLGNYSDPSSGIGNHYTSKKSLPISGTSAGPSVSEEGGGSNTGLSGTGLTGNASPTTDVNTAPNYQEVIAAIKD